MGHHLLSRRQFAATAGLAGLGAGLAVGSEARAAGLAADAAGPAISPREAQAVFARLHGSLDGTTAYSWFEGTVMAVAPGGAVEPIYGVRGIAATRLRRMTGGGWNAERREVVQAYDPARGEAIERLLNPITGITVAPTISPSWSGSYALDEDLISRLSWSTAGNLLLVDQPFRPVSGANDEGPKGFRESLSFIVADVGSSSRGSHAPIPSAGTMLRTTEWPNWLGMSRSPGHLLSKSRFAGGLGKLDDVPLPLREALGRIIPSGLSSALLV